MIAIVDYGVGNLASVRKAFAAVGADAELTRDAERIASAQAVVLPGVGNFGHCSREFHRYGLAAPLRAAREKGTPILGICVGMQLFFEGSDEDAREPGLGFFPGQVRRMTGVPRLPHIGWNAVATRRADRHIGRIPDGEHFYFVHSYAPEASDDVLLGTVDYGGERAAIVGDERIIGVQFHPEKSGASGLRLLRSFAESVTR